MGTIERRVVGLQTSMLSVHTGVTQLVERDSALSGLLSQLATIVQPRRLPDGGSRVVLGSPQQGEAGQEQEQQQEMSVATTPPSQHHLQPKHQSLSTLVAEWFGVGDYEGKPGPGGIEELENRNKSKWRKHFSAAEKRSFSRTKDIIQGIKNRREATELSLGEIVDEWDVVYRGECKASTYHMSEWVKNNGFLARRKLRGRSATAN